MDITDLFEKKLGDGVITLDPSRGLACVFNSNTMKTQPYKKTKNDMRIIASVKFKDLLNTQVNSTNIGEELEDDIAKQVVQNLNLDANSEYVIKHSLIADSEYEAYALNYEQLAIRFEDAINALGYIDYIIAQPRLFEALYPAKVLSADEAHCFLYLDVDDSFIAIYNKGEFKFTRSIGRYNLEYIRAQYVSASGYEIDIDSFLNKLKTEGVQGELVPIFEDMSYYISDVFSGISSVANSGLSTTNTGFSTVYIGTKIGSIPGLANLAGQKLLMDTKDFDFNSKIEGADLDPSCMSTLMFYYAKFCADNENMMNFSPFLRPPSLLKRVGGQFLAVAVVAAVIGLISPAIELIGAGWYFGMDMYENTRLKNKESELAVLEPEFRSNENVIKQQSEDLARLENNINLSKELIRDSKNKKLDYKAKAEFLYDISNFIAAANVKATKISINEQNATISLMGDEDKKITQLIENINDSIKYTVNTKVIALREIVPNQAQNKAENFGIPANKQYESNITIGFRQ